MQINKKVYNRRFFSERKQIMRKVLMFVFAMCLVLFAVSAMAQTSTTGAIEGTVLDPQGRAVPNATVTASGSNITPQSAQTNGSGEYRILNLTPRRYIVTVAATTGFAEAKKDNVEVNLDKTTTVDVGVQIASGTNVVNVTETAG